MQGKIRGIKQNTLRRPGIRRMLNFFFAMAAIAATCTSISLAFHSNYGGHHDIYLMLGSFLTVLHDGIYIPSRFTGYPVAEMGIGASAWIGGSSLSNMVNYSLFLASVLLFPFCFEAKPNLTRYLAFSAMALSSTVLAFDNIMSIDYPWSVFFWVAGCVCLKQFKNQVNAIMPMALAIGSRPVFALFVIASILTIDYKEAGLEIPAIKRLQERWLIIVTTIFAGCLFYLPAWFRHGFGLSWISAEPPDNQGIAGLIGRFLFKLIQSFGVLQSGLIIAITIFLAVDLWRAQRKTPRAMSRNTRFLIVISSVNLLIFARMPVQLSYLQPLLYCTYYTIAQMRGVLFMATSVIITSFNLFNWVYQPRLIRVNYKFQELCSKTVAAGIRLQPWIDEGRIKEFQRASKKAQCYRGWFGQIKQADYSSIILKGEALRKAASKKESD